MCDMVVSNSELIGPPKVLSREVLTPRWLGGEGHGGEKDWQPFNLIFPKCFDWAKG